MVDYRNLLQAEFGKAAAARNFTDAKKKVDEIVKLQEEAHSIFNPPH